MIDITKYSTIIWDWNGTIVDDAKLAFDIYLEECELYCLEKMSYNEYKRRFYFPVSEFYREVGLKDGMYETVANRFSVVYREKWNELKIHAQVEGYLKKFRELNLNQFILSAYRQKELSEMVKYYDLENYFVEISGISDNLANSKVDLGKKLLKNNQIIPEKTLMIGDTGHDFEVAKELGISIVLISWGTISHDKLLEISGDKNIVFNDLEGAFGR